MGQQEQQPQKTLQQLSDLEFSQAIIQAYQEKDRVVGNLMVINAELERRTNAIPIEKPKE